MSTLVDIALHSSLTKLHLWHVKGALSLLHQAEAAGLPCPTIARAADRVGWVCNGQEAYTLAAAIVTYYQDNP